MKEYCGRHGLSGLMPLDAAANLESCRTCHRPLTRRGPSGECLSCLFGWALGADEPTPSAAETLAYGQFEIALDEKGAPRELGCGAMGVTYRARDTVLHRPVALKVIGRGLADDAVSRARFLREARAAARLRHPNVAGVFHYGEQGGECFYAMELVEGHTLEALVCRHGPQGVAATLEIAVQVARALTAAEAEGIVHRDLKPSNIMCAHDGPGQPVIKVIDFGLARAVTAQAGTPGLADTRSGFVGTPAFASPEQYVRENNEPIDTRSDIYSLGVTLWYLLTEKLPFVGQTLAEVREQQIGQPLPLAQLRAASVPAPVVRLLRDMLATARASRPQSARELLAALERCRVQTSPVVASRRRRRWIAAACALSLGIAGVAAGLHRRAWPSAAAPVDRSVAVLPFENLSPDASVAFFAAGVQDQITDELARIAQLKVIGAESTRSYQPGARALAEIGQELGVEHLVEGSVRRAGDSLEIGVQLTNVHRPTPVWTKQYTGRVADEFGIQREITREIATRLRATLSRGEQSELDEPPTRDPVAYDLYLKSNQGSHFFNGPAEMYQATKERIALLDEAVARDPRFVLAYCDLARLHDQMYGLQKDGEERERPIDHRSLAEVFLFKARQVKPDDGNVHLVQARHLMYVTENSEQSRIEIELARRTLPNNAELERTAALIAVNQGRWDDAVRANERGVVLQPRQEDMWFYLADDYRRLRRYRDADRVAVRMLALEPAPGTVHTRWLRAVYVLEERADPAPARAVLAATSDSADSPETQYRIFYGLALALCEHDPDAIARLSAGTTRTFFMYRSVRYPRSWFEGFAARWRGDAPAARAAFTAAREDVAAAVAADPLNSRMLGFLAVIDAVLGDKETAMREARRAGELSPRKQREPYANAAACDLAVVCAWTNQPDQAFALLEDLVKQPTTFGPNWEPTFGGLKLDAIWEPLRADPRFDALVQKLAPPERP